MSVVCLHDGKWSTFIILWSIFSLMKCWSIFTCFVLSWWTRLFAIPMATQNPHCIIYGNSNFFQHPFKSNPFTNALCHSSEFNFYTASCHYKGTIACSRFSVLGTSCSIWIYVRFNTSVWDFLEVESLTWCTLEVLKDSIHNFHMDFSRNMQRLAKLQQIRCQA